MAYDAELQSYRKRVLEFINPKYYNKDELINFFDSPTEHNRRAWDKITNQRTDFLQKLSTELIRQYDIICLEDLNVSGMVKNHHLAKAISDCSWSEFVRMLQYKADWYGKTISKIDRFYPSSQTCSCCGCVNPETKDLSVREWICPDCGVTHDRDINAAKNILRQGLLAV